MRVRTKSNFENFRMPNRLFKDLLKSKLKPLPLLFVSLLRNVPNKFILTFVMDKCQHSTLFNVIKSKKLLVIPLQAKQVGT